MLSSHSWNLPRSTTFPFNLWSPLWLLTSTSFPPVFPCCTLPPAPWNMGLSPWVSDQELPLLISLWSSVSPSLQILAIQYYIHSKLYCLNQPFPFSHCAPAHSSHSGQCQVPGCVLQETNFWGLCVPQRGSQWACAEYVNHSVRPEELRVLRHRLPATLRLPGCWLLNTKHNYCGDGWDLRTYVPGTLRSTLHKLSNLTLMCPLRQVLSWLPFNWEES